MNLAALRAAIDGLVDDGNSCRFYKRWQVMRGMTTKELVEILGELHALQCRVCRDRQATAGRRDGGLLPSDEDALPPGE